MEELIAESSPPKIQKLHSADSIDAEEATTGSSTTTEADKDSGDSSTADENSTSTGTTTTTSSDSNSNDNIANKNNVIEQVTTHEKPTSPVTRSDSVPITKVVVLRKVLSNLYLNATERLRLNNPPRCARDLNYCYQHHYHALLPNAPTFGQAKGLRMALMQHLCLTFIEIAEMMCVQSVFPGDGVMTKIIEMLLVVVPKKMDVNQFQIIYCETLKLFRLLVAAFPPCWLALRPYYVNLFDAPIGYTEREKQSSKRGPERKKFVSLLFELLENTLKECDQEDLSKLTYAIDVDEATENKDANTSREEDSAASMSMSELMNIYDWCDDQICLDNFYALSKRQRLARIFDALELLLHVLERDTTMWLLHHHKKTRKFIFDFEKCPLIVLVYELKEMKRVTDVVRQLFKLYAIATSKYLHRQRLEILERYISLLMEVNNTADLESTDSGYKYPVLSQHTKQLIRELFLVFKSHHPTNINPYIETMEIFRLPYVRYEFIDHFLQLFYFPKNEPFTPKKVAYELIKKKTWKKYMLRAEFTNDNEARDTLCREDYLQLLLNGLRAYSQWHGSQTILEHLTRKHPVKPMQTVTESPYRQCLRSCNRMLLQRIENDIEQLRKDLKPQAIVSMPKVDLPLMDICVDGFVMEKFRTDLKFILILAEQLPKQAELHSDIDFSAWRQFLAAFDNGGADDGVAAVVETS